MDYVGPDTVQFQDLWVLVDMYGPTTLEESPDSSRADAGDRSSKGATSFLTVFPSFTGSPFGTTHEKYVFKSCWSHQTGNLLFLVIVPPPSSMAQFNNYLHVRYCVSSRDGLAFRESLCKFCPYASFSTKHWRVSVPGMGCCPRTYPNGIDSKGCLCLVPTCPVYAQVCVIRTRLYTILPHASSWFQTLPYCMAESQVQVILHIPVSCPPTPKKEDALLSSCSLPEEQRLAHA